MAVAPSLEALKPMNGNQNSRRLVPSQGRSSTESTTAVSR